MMSTRLSKPSPLGRASSPTPSPRGGGSTSFTSLSASQIAQLKESFHLLDHDNDGIISAADLSSMLSSLGLDSSAGAVSQHLAAVGSSGSLNLASYLTHLSALLSMLAPGPELLAAFAAFDENDDGTVDVAELKEALTSVGQDRMTPGDAERALRGFTRRRGLGAAGRGGEVFRYREFVDTLSGKEGDEEKE